MEDIPLYNGKLKNILILSGGGTKGLATLGALTALKEIGIIDKPEIYCGTSVGAIISLLLCIGYSAEDMYYLLFQLDFNTLIVSNIDKILDDAYLGINSVDPLIYTIVTLLKNKNISVKITFKQLFELTKSKLFITGTCLNDATAHYFSVEKTPDMEVMKAIRISISIPFIFKPYKYDNKIWIDGGCMNDYPIDQFCDKLDDVIGIFLDDNYGYYEDFEDTHTYVYKVFKCILKGLNFNKIKMFEKYTLQIKCHIEISTNWNIGNEEKEKMYTNAYTQVIEHYNK
jgi:predicted acylesterase/phospholipase RssA